MRTAVLIHGCHLQADFQGKSWQDIVWGAPEGKLPTLYGRGTMGLYVAVTEKAELIIFSTGASEREGMREGEYTWQYALRNRGLIALALGVSEATLMYYLSDRGELDTESKNTTQEVLRNLQLCANRSINRVFLVSSSWHIQRCHAEALSAAEALRVSGQRVPAICAVGSFGSASEVTVLEPPHRGDRPRTNWHTMARQFYQIREEQRASFEQGFRALVARHC